MVSEVTNTPMTDQIGAPEPIDNTALIAEWADKMGKATTRKKAESIFREAEKALTPLGLWQPEVRKHLYKPLPQLYEKEDEERQDNADMES
jgi:hypothetical protein